MVAVGVVAAVMCVERVVGTERMEADVAAEAMHVLHTERMPSMRDRCQLWVSQGIQT